MPNVLLGPIFWGTFCYLDRDNGLYRNPFAKKTLFLVLDPRKIPEKSPGKNPGELYPNREMLQILGFPGTRKGKPAANLGSTALNLDPTFCTGYSLKSTVPAFSRFSKNNKRTLTEWRKMLRTCLKISSEHLILCTQFSDILSLFLITALSLDWQHCPIPQCMPRNKVLAAADGAVVHIICMHGEVFPGVIFLNEGSDLCVFLP